MIALSISGWQSMQVISNTIASKIDDGLSFLVQSKFLGMML